jgi:hypothetical protein
MELTEPTPEVLRAAALGCFSASFMATELGYSTLATGLLAVAGALITYADMLERRAVRRVAKPRVVRLEAPSASISTSKATVRLAASVAASGGVVAFPALKVDNSALIAALSRITVNAALTESLSASIAALGKAFADAFVESHLSATIDALTAANAEIGRRFAASMSRLAFVVSPAIEGA